MTKKSGVWVTLGDARTTAELERAGFEWLGLDAQHGHFDDRSLREVFTLRRIALATVLVRVAANDATLIGRTLDAGADGVIVPLIDTADQTEAAVAAAHYPPRGRRSWGPLPGNPASSASATPPPFCAVMVETALAIENLDAIVATPGLSMVFVGPFDLSLALGLDVDELLAGRAEHAPLPAVVRACRSAGLVAGAYAGSPARARALSQQGFEWIAVTTDAGVLHLGSAAARSGVSDPHDS